MAPQIPRKRTSIRSRSAKPSSSHPISSSTETTQSTPIDSPFSRTSKEDKRRIKHSSLVSRIEKANKKPTKTRRPSKKLITTLESLAGALPDAPKDHEGDAIVGGARIRHSSLKSRPGAMKKKEKLEKLERDRFAKNMAQMATTQPVAGEQALVASEAGNGTSARWAALRQFIQATLPTEDGKIVVK